MPKRVAYIKRRDRISVPGTQPNNRVRSTSTKKFSDYTSIISDVYDRELYGALRGRIYCIKGREQLNRYKPEAYLGQPSLHPQAVT